MKRGIKLQRKFLPGAQTFIKLVKIKYVISLRAFSNKCTLKYKGKEKNENNFFVWILKIKGKERKRRKLILSNLTELVFI